MFKLSSIETKLAVLFIGKAPKLPSKLRKIIIELVPALALLSSAFAFFSTYSLWQWARRANGPGAYAQQLCNAYTDPAAGACAPTVASRLSFWVWLSLIILVVQGLIYLAAFSGLRRRQKWAWNLLLYSVFGDVLYAICDVFTEYGTNTGLLSSLIGTIISLWILFQIRDAYGADETIKE